MKRFSILLLSLFALLATLPTIAMAQIPPASSPMCASCGAKNGEPHKSLCEYAKAPQSPEDMYSVYDKDGQYQAMQEQMDEVTQKSEAAEHPDKTALILCISIITGLVPIVAIGKKILAERSWETNPSGMWKALALATLGGLALFAFNYGFFYLRLIHNETFRILLPAAIGIAVIVVFIVGMRNN